MDGTRHLISVELTKVAKRTKVWLEKRCNERRRRDELTRFDDVLIEDARFNVVFKLEPKDLNLKATP